MDKPSVRKEISEVIDHLAEGVKESVPTLSSSPREKDSTVVPTSTPSSNGSKSNGNAKRVDKEVDGGVASPAPPPPTASKPKREAAVTPFNESN